MRAEEARKIVEEADKKAMSIIESEEWLEKAMSRIHNFIRKISEGGRRGSPVCLGSFFQESGIRIEYAEKAYLAIIPRLLAEEYSVILKDKYTIEISW